ncbi:hypothetical protein [Alicyclobacillus kakegawensis]|uniref:hypothetical protein n=1 Tax=Alicyclobacillus kakegawensis TaxID=392012 RepID=UPI000831CF6E|nr:hypothetical protein [Alicyclobacillus kakegawensis]
MDDKLDLILQKLESIEAMQKQHGDMIAQLIGVVASTNQKVSDLQSDIAVLKDGQVRQDKILESLALRSLEQETELRELKRAK